MKNRLLKIALGTFVLALTILGSFKYASAYTLYNSLSSTGSYQTPVQFAGPFGNIYDQYDFSGLSATPAAYSVNTNSVTIPIALDYDSACAPYYGATCSFGVKLCISDNGGHTYESTTLLSSSDMQARRQVLLKTFSFSGGIDLYSSPPITHLKLAGAGFGCGGPNPYGWFFAARSDSVTAFQTDSTSACTFCNNVPVTSGSGSADPQNPIIWTNEFTNNLITPDFDNWSNAIWFDWSFLSRPAFAPQSYFVAVSYGTSTNFTLLDRTSWSSISSTSTAAFNITIPSMTGPDSPPVNQILTTGKLNALTPGTYYAQAGLYFSDRPATSTEVDYFVASSTVISFTITSGDKVAFPGQVNTTNQCPGTNFSLAFPNGNAITAAIPDTDPLGFIYHSIFGFSTSSPYTVLDIGQGLCKTGNYLIIPSPDTFNKYTDLWGVIKNKPPFGYFTTSINSASQFSSSTPASTTPMSLGLLAGFVHPIDLALAFLVGLAFLIFIINRLRKWEFHA